MTNQYPVTLESTFSPRFERIQVLYRLLFLAAIGLLHQTAGSLFVVLYLILPLAVAISIWTNRGVGLPADDRQAFVSIVGWVVSLYAYLTFVSDRFPSSPTSDAPRLVVHPSGTPRVGSALGRLFTTIPHAIVLCVLGIAAGLVGFVMAIAVLVNERCPESLYRFQRDVVAWIGRVLAYHASLVETYPPFALGADERTPVRH
jgi:hypothetical protein